jgi:hypothetical protein
MPRFLFHVRFDHYNRSRDELGLDFPDVETAYRETFCAARDIMAVFAACGQHPRDYTIEVVDAADELIFKLPLSGSLDHQALRPTGRFRQ